MDSLLAEKEMVKVEVAGGAGGRGSLWILRMMERLGKMVMEWMQLRALRMAQRM